MDRHPERNAVTIVKPPKALTERLQEGEADGRHARGGIESLLVNI